jgi:hypothetical protein
MVVSVTPQILARARYVPKNRCGLSTVICSITSGETPAARSAGSTSWLMKR